MNPGNHSAVRALVSHLPTLLSTGNGGMSRGLDVHHSTIFFVGVQQYALSYLKNVADPSASTNDSWRSGETTSRLKARTRYLCHAVDSTGQTLDI